MVTLTLSCDLAAGDCWDLTDAVVAGVLVRLCEEGMVDALVGGPPRATHALAHYDKGREPYRIREDAKWGRSGLSGSTISKEGREHALIIIHMTVM